MDDCKIPTKLLHLNCLHLNPITSLKREQRSWKCGGMGKETCRASALAMSNKGLGGHQPDRDKHIINVLAFITCIEIEIEIGPVGAKWTSSSYVDIIRNHTV